VLSRIDRPAPASSLTWAIEFVHPPAPAAPAQPAAPPAPAADHWWFYRSETETAAGGYAHESAALWDPIGRLVALSRQAVAVFA
jgi:acyl-CoA thioesterase